MLKKGVILFLLIVIAISIGSADFNIGNVSHSVETEYIPNETLRGWVNLSFDNERADSKFYDSLGNYIEILELIKSNPGYAYSCSTEGCIPEYSASNGQESKSFVLAENAYKTLGFQLFGGVNSIESVEFEIRNTAPTSCENPLKVDILADGIIEIASNVSSSEICPNSTNYGCFDHDGITENFILSPIPYCQKITFDEGPGFKIGAWVEKIGSGSANLVAYVFEGNTVVKWCDLPEATNPGGEISCDVDLLVTTPKNYFVCIYAHEQNLYNIKGNINPGTKCGFYGKPVKNPTGAYKIFVKQKKFAEFPTMVIKDRLPNGRTISSLLSNYIDEKYGSIGCFEGCTFPIKVKSGANQTITFRKLSLVYRTTQGLINESDFYDLTETPARVNSNFQKLFLDQANFTLLEEYGGFEYNLNLNGEDIFTEDLEIVRVPIIGDINPNIAGLTKTTNFTVEIDSDYNLTKYDWLINGVKKMNTTTNKIILTFNILGINNITLNVTDSNNRTSSKDFVIYVYSPETQIAEKISELKARIELLKSQIQDYPSFYRRVIEEAIALEDSENLLEDIEKAYEDAENGEDYLAIINDLEAIDLPESVSTTKSADQIDFFPEKENIRPDYISDIGGGDYYEEDEEEYVDAILSWHQTNAEIKISFKEVSITHEGNIDPLLTIYDLKVNGNFASPPYLIIKDINGLEFIKDYEESKGNNFYYIEVAPEQEVITFSTVQEIDFVNLPVFISPYLDDLDLGPGRNGDDEGTSKWIFFILIIVFIIIIAFVVYIVLQEWYKNKYETHLFKDRNNLFNLVSYINNQKRKSISDDEIIKKLRKSKWNSEQIVYAMKKYEGKKTGMYEVPILNIFKKKNKSPPKRGYFGLPPPSRGLPPPRKRPI